MKKIKQLWMLFIVQLESVIKLNIRYLNSTVSQMFLYAGAFLIVLFVTDTSKMARYYNSKAGVLVAMIGYLFWSIGISSFQSCSNGVEIDEREGTLESEMQSAYPLWLIYLFQILGENIIVWLELLVISIVTCFLSHFTFNDLISSLLLTFVFSQISNLGMFGMGMFLASGSIRFKKMGQWSVIISSLLMMFSNVFSPAFLGIQEIIPYVCGVELVRNIVLGQGFVMHQFLIFLLVNAAWLIAGIIVFSYSIKYERKNGSFDAF